MATVKLQNGKVILKDGKVSCECCCCEEVVFYSYDNSIPPGKNYDECPNVSADCSQDPPASCCGESVSGYIRSKNFGNGCKNNTTRIPKAKIYSGATIDNIGNIGGANFQPDGTCPNFFYRLNSDEVIESVEIVDNGNGTFYLKMPFSASNDASCGPYGIMNATVKWYFGEECGGGSSGQGIGLSLL